MSGSRLRCVGGWGAHEWVKVKVCVWEGVMELVRAFIIEPCNDCVYKICLFVLLDEDQYCINCIRT